MNISGVYSYIYPCFVYVPQARGRLFFRRRLWYTVRDKPRPRWATERRRLALPLPKEPHYTYANLLAWEDDTRYELFDGTPVALASPSQEHQRILTALLLQLAAYLEDKP